MRDLMAPEQGFGAPSVSWPSHAVQSTRELASRVVIFGVVVIIAALASSADDWQPVSLVAALAILMIVADALPVPARQIRLSAGLMIQVVAMALLGPAPAVAIGATSTLIESWVYRVPPRHAFNNVVVFSVLGLVGGIVFDLLRSQLGVDRDATTYALAAMPIYCALAALNLAMVVMNPAIDPKRRLRILRDTGLPSLPFELLSSVMAGAVILVWGHAGIVSAAALLGLLVISIPLLRAIGDALRRGDDLVALRDVSDERSREVARLASDRERLLSELFEVEQRERARLAESLHDGPMQRLVALHQDTVERDGGAWNVVAEHLQRTIAETRAIISAFHPATVRELGFEASLRAAVAHFPAAQSIQLRFDSAVDDRSLAGTILLPVAQELVVNAVKHASPSTIALSVRFADGRVVLEVNDDGLGIDTSDAGRKVQAGHLGLAMVRRRVEDAGGALDIETRADGGTHSRVTIPIDFGSETRTASE
jgi:signal transduction histidine kinase